VRYKATDGVADVFERHAGYISGETLATQLAPGLDAAEDWHHAEAEIDGASVVVAVRRESGA
jgi:hypothetical protein